MATIERAVRLVNPGKKRKLSAAQKLFFGSKRQRIAVAKSFLGNSNRPRRKFKKRMKLIAKGAPGLMRYKGPSYLPNARKRRAKSKYPIGFSNRKSYKAFKSGHGAKHIYYGQKSAQRRAKRDRLPNVGEIITIHPLINSGHRTNLKNRTERNNKGKGMAKRRGRKRSLRVAIRRRYQSARKAVARVYHRVLRHKRRGRPRRAIATNPGVRYIRRRRHAIRNRRHYRRNPGGASGFFGSNNVGKAVGVIGGAFVTNMLTGFVPAQFNTGIIGYVATGIIATLQGKAVGKLLKNPALGNDMVLGGYVYLALRIAQDMFPSVGLPFRLSGMGNVIGPSSFWTPQVPLNGSMGTFVRPSMMGPVPVAVSASAGMRGLGAGMVRRVGRMR